MVRIDVHGYRIYDAKVAVEQIIHLAKQQQSLFFFSVRRSEINVIAGDTHKIAIHIITGEGYHSLRRQPKIKPALIKYFQSNRYRFKDMEGSLVVFI